MWCDDEWGDRDVVVENEVALRTRVLPLCTDDWQHFTQLAERLDEVPWDINRACLYLARRIGSLVEGVEKLRGFFKLPGRITAHHLDITHAHNIDYEFQGCEAPVGALSKRHRNPRTNESWSLSRLEIG